MDTINTPYDTSVQRGRTLTHMVLYMPYQRSIRFQSTLGNGLAYQAAIRKVGSKQRLHINRLIAKIRARVEHPFRVLKRQFGYIKTRYRGLAKNRAQLFSLFALGNLYLVRRQLMA